MLSWTIYTSFLGAAVLTLLPRDHARAARAVALLTALLGFALALGGTLEAGGGASAAKERSAAKPQPKTANDNREIREIRGKLHFALAQEIPARMRDLDR